MIHKHITDCLYRATYHLYIGDGKEMVKKIKRRFNIDLDIKNASGSFRAICDERGEENLIIWMDKYDEDNLVHELAHAAIYVFHKRGISITSKHDEPFCYYFGWLFGRAKCSLKS